MDSGKNKQFENVLDMLITFMYEHRMLIFFLQFLASLTCHEIRNKNYQNYSIKKTSVRVCLRSGSVKCFDSTHFVCLYVGMLKALRPPAMSDRFVIKRRMKNKIGWREIIKAKRSKHNRKE